MKSMHAGPPPEVVRRAGRQGLHHPPLVRDKVCVAVEQAMTVANPACRSIESLLF